MVNIKPSRFGPLSNLFEMYDWCEREGVQAYGGGQTELGPGRGHIQYLASLFHPDTPNDTAPSGYNKPAAARGAPDEPARAAHRAGRLPLAAVIEAHPLHPGGDPLEMARRIAALPRRGARVARPRALRRAPAGRAGRHGGRRAPRGGRARRARADRLQRRPPRADLLPAAAADEAGAARGDAVPHLRHPRHPGPDAPQVRGARRRVGLDRLDELDDGLVDAPGERDRAWPSRRPSSPPSSRRTSRSCGARATWTPAGTRTRGRSRWTAARCAPGSRRATARSSRTGSPRRSGAPRERVRIASPVITAGPVLGTLAEVAAEQRVDLRGVVDRTQMDQVVYQWRTNGHSAWKIPILASVLAQRGLQGQAVDAVDARDAPRLHAREGHRGGRLGVRRLVQPVALGRDERRERARGARRRAGRPARRLHRRGPRALRAYARA